MISPTVGSPRSSARNDDPLLLHYDVHHLALAFAEQVVPARPELAMAIAHELDLRAFLDR